MTKTEWVNQLQLMPHPEGGFYKETYRSKLKLKVEALGERNLSTGIYFLLEKENFSAFHRIKSDEMWHFYAGGALVLHMIDEEGNYAKQLIGANIQQGEKLQFVVPAGVWFATEVDEGVDFTLVGCTVAFGFDFEDFELADASFSKKFPLHKKIIQRLTR